MTRGCRDGVVTKDKLADRLRMAQPSRAVPPPRTTSLPTLLGHAMYYGLVSDRERAETLPREITTVPSYLYTHLTDDPMREAVGRYVTCHSVMYRRGTVIANLVAQDVCGAALPPPLAETAASTA